MPTTIFTDALPNAVGGFGGLSIRNELPITGGSLGQVRVTFASAAGANLITDHCSIGVSAQNGTGSSTATPIELTFTGASGFNIGPSSTIVSDWVTLAFAITDLLIVDLDTNASNGGIVYDTVDTNYRNTGASYNVQTVAGFSSNPQVVCVALIETQSGGGDVLMAQILT